MAHPRGVRWRSLFVLLLVLVTLACRKPAAQDAPIALPSVTDTSTDLLLTWIDEKGEFHIEQKAADVPAAAREFVRVNDPVKDPPKIDDVFVADLRTPLPDGTYPIKTMPRPDFEKIAVERRQKSGKILAPQGPASVLPADARPLVVIYGAEWCGPCHQAANYFTKKGVAFVKKDIEQDSGAAREMQAKLQSAGMRGGSIPVIDVRGKILIGFDQGAVDRALGQPL